ncbi:antibiotic biosynthesis monooxygenase family protein [Bradyrhizobium sp. DASA03007]|uniref:antibiotic biosynthesis monooxygenase family protein n=1 Tax=unclassified Bradyrhizobium TaxID=2631580 RepID=UPI003F71C9D8
MTTVSRADAAKSSPSPQGNRPMIVTIFRSRLNPGVEGEYGPTARQMSELARTIPGYISHKGFVAEDGERVTIVEFESEEALQEWRHHPEHAKAKRRGIQSFFSDYKFQICTVIRDRVWSCARPTAKS